MIAEGNRAEASGETLAACEHYRKALDIAPAYAKAHLNMAIGLEALGNVEDAFRSYNEALAIDPADAYANYNVGRFLLMRGALADAEMMLRRALESRPEFPEAGVVLASVFEARDDAAAAAEQLEVVLRTRPNYFGALRNYAAVLAKLKRSDEAESALRKAVALEPGDFEVNRELGMLLKERADDREAEAFLCRALIGNPDALDVRTALFHLHLSQGNLASAAAEIDEILKRKPDWVDAVYNRGVVLTKQTRSDEAEKAFRRAIEIDPEYWRAYEMLGAVLLRQCRIEEALQLYRTAREHRPDSFDPESAELFALNCLDDASIADIFARHVAFGARLEKAYRARFEPFANLPDPERRLRIGYVSGDFRFHVVTLFLLPLLEHHDRSAFELYCYSTSDATDRFSREIRARTDVWHDVASLTETELAELINRDAIDILVDLTGHSGEPNLEVFAQRPAPVQVTWLGYLNTTGMTRIQYRLSDNYCDPPGLTDRIHTETLVRLPHSQWCYRPFVTVEAVSAPPVERNGFVTFGSFNQTTKLSLTTRRLWAEILGRLPDSRLVIIGVDKGRAQEDLARDLSRQGVAPHRIEIVPYVLSLEEYFRWYNAVDIALDTTPYSGGTTTCDAIWMGVPVVTMPGPRPWSRSAASVLSTVGLIDWIASTPEDYVRRAVHCASDHAQIAHLRTSLRSRMLGSPLMDETRYARDVEDAYRRMWRKWCTNSGT